MMLIILIYIVRIACLSFVYIIQKDIFDDIHNPNGIYHIGNRFINTKKKLINLIIPIWGFWYLIIILVKSIIKIIKEELATLK